MTVATVAKTLALPLASRMHFPTAFENGNVTLYVTRVNEAFEAIGVVADSTDDCRRRCIQWLSGSSVECR